MNSSQKFLRTFFRENHHQKCFLRGLLSISQVSLSNQTTQNTCLKKFIPASSYSSFHKPYSKIVEREEKRGNVKTDIFINGRDFKCDHDYLRDIFAQFGDVMVVDIPKSTVANNKYKHAFIKFYSEESCAKALKAKKIKIGPNNYLYIKGRSVPIKERSYMISNLTQNINVQQLHEYFRKHGEVEIINLCFTESYLSTSSHGAVMVLREKLDDILTLRHQIDGLPLLITKCLSTEHTRKNKGRSIIIEGPLKDVTRSQIISHYKKFGRIDGLDYLPGRLAGSLAEIKFQTQQIAYAVAKDATHQIENSLFKARALGYHYRDDLYQ